MKNRGSCFGWRRVSPRYRRTLLVAVLLLFLLALVPAVAGCGLTVGVTQEKGIDEPLGSAAVTDVDISMGLGSLTIGPGAVGFASGTIRYNVKEWVPTVTRGDSTFTIKQSSRKAVPGLSTDIVNEWNLQFGKAPMRLKVSAGAYTGSYDMSGLTLQEFSIHDGAAKSQVMFNSPNPGQMAGLVYETGASSVELIGLANANFKSMTFTGGAGSYSLDFSGQLRTSAPVKIETGAGSVHLTVPSTTAAKVQVSGSRSHVSTQGQWTQVGRTYSTPAAANAQAKVLSISLKMSVGTVTLVAE